MKTVKLFGLVGLMLTLAFAAGCGDGEEGEDAGTRDTGQPRQDAGDADAGMPDGGGEDAGDTGVPDAGPPDTGPITFAAALIEQINTNTTDSALPVALSAIPDDNVDPNTQDASLFAALFP